jgi:hypothetical protein
MWNLVGASVSGTSHVKSRLPCQDYCGHTLFDAHGEQYLAMALSDGAGSATHSQVGSRIAVQSTLSSLAEIVASQSELTEDLAIRVLEQARTRIEEHAESEDLSSRQLACTLLFAVISARVAYFAQLGDGGWVMRINGELLPATWPFRGEYANETFFLTSKNWREGFQFEKVAHSITAVAGFTDGIQPVALQYETRSAHAPFFNPLFKVLEKAYDGASLKPALEAFLNVEALNERTDDDKTLILATRRPLHLLEWTTTSTTTKTGS